MLLKKINRILGILSGFLVLITAFIMLYDVISRYFLGAPTVWAQNICQYTILTAAFLGTSYALESGGHVNVEIVVERVGPLAAKILLTIGNIFALVFVGGLVKSCFSYTVIAYQMSWDASGNLPIPACLLYSIMVFGSSILFLTLIASIIDIWKKRKDKEVT